MAVAATEEDSDATGVNGNQLSNTTGSSGAVYVFERSPDGTWSEQAYIKASNPSEIDRFGSSIAIHENLLAVGVGLEDSMATGVNGPQDDVNPSINSGAVYLFSRNSDNEWSQIAYVKSANNDEGDWFGSSVALDGDGVIVVSLNEDSGEAGIDGNPADNSISNSGAVHIMR